MSSRPAYTKLGKYLASTREAGGMSQAQLAQKLGRVQSVVAKTETGRRRLDVVEFIELAKALGVSPQRLFEGVLSQLR
jgi:transcriptional regulator with XRE-family HTH domain